MLKPDSPIYPLCVELRHILDSKGKAAMNERWSQYVEERKSAKSPVKLWEQGAIADTVRGLQNA